MAPLPPIVLVSPLVPGAPLEPIEPVAPGAVAVLSAAPVPLTAAELELEPIPLLEPVPAAPGVLVAVGLDGVLFAADLSSPQPAIVNASATLAAMVSSLVMSRALSNINSEVVWHCTHTRSERKPRASHHPAETRGA
jgi:hypothetical protein